MKIVDSLDPESWSAFVLRHPKGSVFHTPEMFEVFRKTRHYTPLLLAALDDDGKILALLISVKVQTLPGILAALSSRAILFAEPISCNSEDGTAALQVIVKEHDRRMRHKVLFTEVRPLYQQSRERLALEACGYEHARYLNYINDLRKGPEEMLQCMTKNARRDVRKGQRQGLTPEDATSISGVDEVYPLLQETFALARVPLASKELFVNALNVLSPRNMIRLFVVRLEGRPVAGSIVLCHRETVFFWYAGMARLKNICSMEVLYFEMLQWGHTRQYTTFDAGGAGWPDKPYGVREFKAKFGGELVDYGRYRKIYSPLKFAVAEKAYEVSRNLWNVRPESEPANA
jgi:lipid II:glycine glycyltransferase (peptidoglycan interpeptide bridge formation enzyme)